MLTVQRGGTNILFTRSRLQVSHGYMRLIRTMSRGGTVQVVTHSLVPVCHILGLYRELQHISVLVLKQGQLVDHDVGAYLILEQIERGFGGIGFDPVQYGHMHIVFTTTGRYEDLLVHIDCHKYYMNQNQPEEIPYRQAMLDWYDTVYIPIVQIIREERLVGAFRGRTESDLYVWVVRHWDELCGKLLAMLNYNRKHRVQLKWRE